MSPSISSKPRSEAEVLAATLAFLHSIRGMFERRNTGGMSQGERYVKFNEPGTPDITGVLWPGIPFAVECKREGWEAPGSMVERGRFFRQLDWLTRWSEAGGVGIVATDAVLVSVWADHARRDRAVATQAAISHLDLWRLRARK